MNLTGWGRYPHIDAKVVYPQTLDDAAAILEQSSGTMIGRGLGRSYGDSSLASQVVCTEALNYFHSFDSTTGILHCSAGVSLAEILNVFVPKGWFLPVTPGTQFVTVGGAIASDVHGKNHHRDGSFSDHLQSFTIATMTDGVLECSRHQHQELFQATCGGMGLTGLILTAAVQLKSIQSAYIEEVTLKADNLEHALNLFAEHESATYSVAWIDCLSTGASLGRSLIMLGEHSASGSLAAGKPGKLIIPLEVPAAALNRYSIQAFNAFYYARIRQKKQSRRVHYAPFFYPLDSIRQWNKLYGKNGFLQYQFVLPKGSGLEGMHNILKRIAASKRGSFLAVLKATGKDNGNYLSFPIEGYSLALDFKVDTGIFELLNELDDIVIDYGGRLYLTKDARMTEAMFKTSYPKWEQFAAVRTRYGADKKFHSLQSQRLGL